MNHHKHVGEAVIFVQPNNRALNVDDFARDLFRKLKISSYKDWGIPNQDARSNFVGNAAGIQISIFEPYNDDNPKGYRFVIYLKPEIAFGDSDYLVEHARNMAKHWSHSGWRCFVPNEKVYEISNENDGTVYQPLVNN